MEALELEVEEEKLNAARSLRCTVLEVELDLNCKDLVLELPHFEMQCRSCSDLECLNVNCNDTSMLSTAVYVE